MNVGWRAIRALTDTFLVNRNCCGDVPFSICFGEVRNAPRHNPNAWFWIGSSIDKYDCTYILVLHNKYDTI